jgi:hypothetical protein
MRKALLALRYLVIYGAKEQHTNEVVIPVEDTVAHARHHALERLRNVGSL